MTGSVGREWQQRLGIWKSSAESRDLATRDFVSCKATHPKAQARGKKTPTFYHVLSSSPAVFNGTTTSLTESYMTIQCIQRYFVPISVQSSSAMIFGSMEFWSID